MKRFNRLPVALSLGLTMLMAVTGPASAKERVFHFNAANFTAGAAIDNPYLPLTTGATLVYAAESPDGCEVNELQVTGNTKDDFEAPYDSVVAWEVEDRAWFSEGCTDDYALAEETLDWYAQDKRGNVWYMGEATVAYDHEDECPTSGGSWQAGTDGALAGVVMPRHPGIGDWYKQEFLEGEAEDRAKVLRLNANVAIGLGTYAGCLRTKEYSPLSPGDVEQKNYCPEGGGLLLINELHGGKTLHVEFIGNSRPAGNYPATGVCP